MRTKKNERGVGRVWGGGIIHEHSRGLHATCYIHLSVVSIHPAAVAIMIVCRKEKDEVFGVSKFFNDITSKKSKSQKR